MHVSFFFFLPVFLSLTLRLARVLTSDTAKLPSRVHVLITFPQSASQVFFRYQLQQAGGAQEEGYRDRALSKTPLLLGILNLEEEAKHRKIKSILQELDHCKVTRMTAFWGGHSAYLFTVRD